MKACFWEKVRLHISDFFYFLLYRRIIFILWQ